MYAVFFLQQIILNITYISLTIMSKIIILYIFHNHSKKIYNSSKTQVSDELYH